MYYTYSHIHTMIILSFGCIVAASNTSHKHIHTSTVFMQYNNVKKYFVGFMSYYTNKRK